MHADVVASVFYRGSVMNIRPVCHEPCEFLIISLIVDKIIENRAQLGCILNGCLYIAQGVTPYGVLQGRLGPAGYRIGSGGTNCISFVQQTFGFRRQGYAATIIYVTSVSYTTTYPS